MNLYFDNASTSFPKPSVVAEAISSCITNCGGTYGRGSYPRVLRSTSIVEDCRDLVGELLGLESGDNIFFTANATGGSNTVLKGISDALEGRVIYITALEHNAIMRPLEYLKEHSNILVKILPSAQDGRVIVSELHKIEGDIALVIINHQSNVNGVIQPLDEIVAWARGRSARTMVDSTQSLGDVTIDMDYLDLDYLIFTGHKCLYGPTGIGGFYAKAPESISPLIHGGTGSNSDSYSMPVKFPDKFEAGTPNIIGAAGLKAALENRPQYQHTKADFMELIMSIEAIPGVTLYRSFDLNFQGTLFSLTHRSIASSQICKRLSESYNIETRQGLHCSPAAHNYLGTLSTGSLRIATSPYHTKEDFMFLISSLKEICHV